MTTFVSKEVLDALEQGRRRAQKRSSRLRVKVGGKTFAVLDYRNTGFALDLDDAPKLRGLVDLYDGARHLSQCLIVASEEDGHVMRYEFKRATPATDRAPLDFVRDETAPVALIGPFTA